MGSKASAPPEGLRARLMMLIGGDKPFAWARRVGISKGGMQNLLDGGIPRDKTINKIIAATGVSSDWLLYGKGEMRSPAPPEYRVERTLDSHLGTDLLREIIEAVEQALAASSRRLPPAEKARLVSAAAKIYMSSGSADRKGALGKITLALLDLLSAGGR